MSEKIVQLNEDVIKGQLKELVRGSVEETLNEPLEAVGEVFPEAKYQRCRPLLPQYLLCSASFQGEAGSEDAQGDPRPREQESCPGEGKGCGEGTAFHEAKGGC